MSQILFGYTSFDMKIFFKKVFRNMEDFWDDMKINKIINEMDA